MKFEEVEQNVPSLPVLRKCASNVYSVEIIKKMELAGAPRPPPSPTTNTTNPARARTKDKICFQSASFLAD